MAVLVTAIHVFCFVIASGRTPTKLPSPWYWIATPLRGSR
jgi:hypothetical protein